MAKDPEKNSEFQEHIGADEADEFEEEEVVDARPSCPRCGWHNTRPSHSKSFLDTMLRTFSLRPYRCRSCGNRFRVIRRASQHQQ